ncbi:hypothetical protein ASC77_25855 [Nocardioides sp. Root1257]|uniref:DUF1015 family protein n=1 Tax=unclassified Nocardioides TaxID=2615069 RepID=UPI0006F2A659|nr:MULTISPECIES: DUF1015 family protein [unclassified Nocardioides]KQW49735.1 hypothetical protein ASC77_25855 [Nocardioides sp. Root1257]KRC50376.1 hypothetical protein ASE24_25860 [Nocardioides sp. Root224]
MDSGVVATPTLVTRPLRLEPFRALMLAPNRIGAHASARSFARPYRDVAARFDAWQQSGQVTQDSEAALYLHEYTTSGVTIRGLVGALDLTREARSRDEVAVYPHEGVHPAQAAELADRMADMAMNPAPILLTHRAPAGLRALLRDLRQRAADHQFTDRSGQYHRVWALRDADALTEIGAGLSRTRALIADGHHRYAAYGRLRADHPELAPATDAGLAMLVDLEDTPLFLGAIHRVLPGVSLRDLDLLGDAVRAAAGPQEAVAALAPTTVVATDGHDWATISLPRTDDRLTVEILHEDVLPMLPASSAGPRYAHSVDEALSAVARRRGLAILMPVPDVVDVLRAAEHGRLLPEKATSFQPKPSVGVLIRSLRDE